MEREARDETVPLLGRKNVDSQVSHSLISREILQASMGLSGSCKLDMNSNQLIKAEREHRRKISMNMPDVLEPITLTWQHVNVYAPLPSKRRWPARAAGSEEELKQILFDGKVCKSYSRILSANHRVGYYYNIIL